MQLAFWVTSFVSTMEGGLETKPSNPKRSGWVRNPEPEKD